MVFNLAVLLAEMVLLNVLLLTLHSLSPRYGIVPVVATAATLVGILRFASSVGVYVEIAPGLRFTITGNVFIPTILLIVLVLYVVEGTIPARLTLLIIIGMEVLSLLLYNGLAWHLRQPGGGSFATILPNDPLINPTIKVVAASSLAFILDLYGIAIVFQSLVNFAPRLPLWLKSGLTLVVAMALNSFVFWTFAADSLEEFVNFVPGGIIGGMIAAIALTPVLAIYLGRVAPRMPTYRGLERRPTFALLFGTFGQMERELERRQSALQAAEARYRSEVDHQRMRAERLREFVNEVVHDMRSPLTGINLRINLLHRSSDVIQRQKHLDSIQAQVERLSELMEVVVEIARLEREPTSKKQVADLSPFAQTIFESVRATGETKSLVMVWKSSDELLLVRLDAMTFGRALTNLLENAIRYTNAGSVTMHIGREGDNAVIEIRDTGIGIAEDDLSNIFERYFRARSERSTTLDHGLGLGLAIVKRVVEQHGGTISVESVVHQGTTFRLMMPKKIVLSAE